MTKEKFVEILKEYKFSDHQINLLWNSKPPGNLDEQRLRKTAERIAPKKDSLIQA